MCKSFIDKRIRRIEQVWPAPRCPMCATWPTQVSEVVDEHGAVIKRCRQAICPRCGELHPPTLLKTLLLVSSNDESDGMLA